MKKALKPGLKPGQARQVVFEKISWLNQLRKLSGFEDDLIGDLMQIATMTGNKKLFDLIENVLTPLAMEQLIRPTVFKKAPSPEIQENGNNMIYIGKILSGGGC